MPVIDPLQERGRSAASMGWVATSFRYGFLGYRRDVPWLWLASAAVEDTHGGAHQRRQPFQLTCGLLTRSSTRWGLLTSAESFSPYGSRYPGAYLRAPPQLPCESQDSDRGKNGQRQDGGDGNRYRKN